MQCVRKGLQRADSRGCVSRYKLVFPGAISRFHHVEMGTPEYLDMLRAYIRAMRRLHQKIFYIQLDEQCVNIKEPIAFDFEYLTPVIQCFFEEGMEIMEIGALLHRGFLPDGSPDMYTDSFTCMMDKNLKFDTLEGYVHTVKLVQALASYLKKHGWEKKILFHIHDEPDIHVKDREALEARRRQYYLAAGILRKYLPGVQIIEAVDTAEFYGGVDIWVPGTAGYEKKKDEFDQLIRLGELCGLMSAAGRRENAESFSGFSSDTWKASVLGLCQKQDFRIPSLGI